MYYTILFANYVILFGLWPVPDGASQLRFSTVCLHNNVCCIGMVLYYYYFIIRQVYSKYNQILECLLYYCYFRRVLYIDFSGFLHYIIIIYNLKIIQVPSQCLLYAYGFLCFLYGYVMDIMDVHCTCRYSVCGYDLVFIFCFFFNLDVRVGIVLTVTYIMDT